MSEKKFRLEKAVTPVQKVTELYLPIEGLDIESEAEFLDLLMDFLIEVKRQHGEFDFSPDSWIFGRKDASTLINPDGVLERPDFIPVRNVVGWVRAINDGAPNLAKVAYLGDKPSIAIFDRNQLKRKPGERTASGDIEPEDLYNRESSKFEALARLPNSYPIDDDVLHIDGTKASPIEALESIVHIK
jgi:hypothetical protein